jgi:magnesium-transporting ATPase (P-type)
MSNSLDEVFLIGGSLIFGLPLPLTAIQIIWVNFFTGSLPALSFAFDENKDISHSRGKEAIFNREVNVLTVGIGVLTSILLFVLYWFMLAWGTDVETARAVLFLCFSGYILVVAFSLKSLQKTMFFYPMFDNRALNLSVLAAGMLIVASMTVPFLRDILSLQPIAPVWLLLVAGWLVFNVLLVEVAKWLYRGQN